MRSPTSSRHHGQITTPMQCPLLHYAWTASLWRRRESRRGGWHVQSQEALNAAISGLARDRGLPPVTISLLGHRGDADRYQMRFRDYPIRAFFEITGHVMSAMRSDYIDIIYEEITLALEDMGEALQEYQSRQRPQLPGNEPRMPEYSPTDLSLYPQEPPTDET